MGKSSFGSSKLSIGRVLSCFNTSGCSSASCFCTSSFDEEEENEQRSLIGREAGQVMRIRDIVQGNQTLAFHLKPKMVVLRVSMHCNGCAKKVEKHISKMGGVISFEVDFETKKVTVVGDLAPFEVLESVSKVKFAEIWNSSHDDNIMETCTYIGATRKDCESVNILT